MNHDHSDDHSVDLATRFTREYWDHRYGSDQRIWSGNVNQRLAEQAAGLPPGAALDLGCGEGADALWLARQGWEVTALDVSAVAVERAAAHAAATDPDAAARITWQQADLMTWEPPAARFDLVSIQFLHFPRPQLEALLNRLATSVRPGGTLLVVAHHPSDLDTTAHRPDHPELFLSPDELAALLPSARWNLVEVAGPARETTGPDGRSTTIHDAVVRATRRPDAG